MDRTRREFLKTVGVAGVAIASSDLIADLLAQSPKADPLHSKFKGLADIALVEAKLGGCSYADIRFTRTMTLPAVNVTASNGGDAPAADAGGFGGRGGGGRGGGRGGGGGGFGFGGRGENAGPPNDPDGTPRAGGFGVRVIHGGVWGFASSPIVSEDEIRRITRVATEVAKASAIAKKVNVQLAPTPAYQLYWSTEMQQDPRSMSDADKRRTLQAAVDAAIKHKNVVSATANVGFSSEWKYFASSEGSYIEQEMFSISPSFSVTGKRGDVTRSRNLEIPGGTGGWELVEEKRPASRTSY
jgi:TldD protein